MRLTRDVMTSARTRPSAYFCTYRRRYRGIGGYANLHDNENGADDYALDSATEQRVGDYRKRFVDNHVRQKKRDQEQMTIFANGFDLVRVFTLLAKMYEE